MSALIDSMYSVREVPWHREGEILADYPGSWAEAREAAGLAWEAIEEPVYKLSGVEGDDLTPVYSKIEAFKQVVRSDNGLTLAVRPQSYQIIGNADMGAIIEAVLAQPNVKYETAGSLSEGRAVWALAKLDEPFTVPGDFTPTLPYLAVLNRHDGQGACSLTATAVRVVCANTFKAAELDGERTRATFSFRHTKNWSDRVDEARDAVTGARREIAEYKALAARLFGIRVTSAQRELFVAEFIPMPPAGLVSDRVVANVETARNAVRAILKSETTEPIAHTAYGLLQAAGEYADHVRTARTWETRLGRSLLKHEPLKRRAINIIDHVLTKV